MFRVEVFVYDLDRSDAPWHLRSFLANLSKDKVAMKLAAARQHGRYTLVVFNESTPTNLSTCRIADGSLGVELREILSDRDPDSHIKVTVMGLPDAVLDVRKAENDLTRDAGPPLVFDYL